MSNAIRKNDREPDIQISAQFPESYLKALDIWISNQGDNSMSRSDGLRAILAEHLGLQACRTYRRRPSAFEQIEEEERIFALYERFGSYTAVAQHEHVAKETIRRKIARRSRRLRSSQVKLRA